MRNILEEIVTHLRPDLERRKREMPLSEDSFPVVPSFSGAFPGVIAEIKKASPSKGMIRRDFSPAELALELEKSGAAALSVLTEPNYFLGSLSFLKEVAKKVKIPVLRKDFIFDPYQILEARHAGASAILLIAAMLEQKELVSLGEYARKLGLDVLGEAHNEEEIRRLLDSPVTLVGVNARDLHSFSTDLARVEKLIGLVPQERLPVAESAIRSADDIRRLREAGAKGFLIGETLMRAEHPGKKLEELLDAER
ncbi:MAG: indole-3-glycerol phosphate synthase TrpC [Lentisphaeria bacterium]|nr:indole-3-glycerol phosphate synthase TrpC [Lentisphaeria bacterium]